MKGKYLIPIVLLSLLMISPVAAFWHLPDQEPKVPCTTWALQINGKGTDATHRFNFTEPEFQYCKTFVLEVWILNVTDLYGYDFIVTGDHWSTYFELQSYKYKEFQDLIWGVGNWFSVYPEIYDPTNPYRQAVSAKKPATGAPKGTYKLAELTFHIKTDWCWCCGNIDGHFYFTYGKLSDSCSGEIEFCDVYNAFYTLKPVQPVIFLSPKYEENCKVGDTFKMKVMIANVTKMKSLHFDLRWNGWHLATPYDPDLWITLLYTSKAAITVNPAVFPTADIATDYPKINLYYSGTPPHYCSTSGIVFDIVLKDGAPLRNVTAATWVVEIEFTKHDPWYCGRQPMYTGVHDAIRAENATTFIWFQSGYFDVKCPELCNIYFGEFLGAEGSTKGVPDKSWLFDGDMPWPFDILGYIKWMCVADFAKAKYEFDPVEGDLNGDGVVDIADLKILASFYDKTNGQTVSGMYAYYYNLNKPSDSIVDIFDLVIVAKHFGDSCTGHSTP